MNNLAKRWATRIGLAITSMWAAGATAAWYFGPHATHEENAITTEALSQVLEGRDFCGVSTPPGTEAQEANPLKEPDNYVSWWIADVVPGLTRELMAADMEKVHRETMAVCGVRLEPAASRDAARLIITSKPIDGPGAVLAWCEMPDSVSRKQREMRFDASERWTRFDNEARAVVFETTYRHEFGHRLGLPHRNSPPPNVMEPVYRAGVTGWADYDIQELTRRYGAPTAPPAPAPADRLRIDVLGDIKGLAIPGYKVEKTP